MEALFCIYVTQDLIYLWHNMVHKDTEEGAEIYQQ